jgi:hypothetical protein
VVVKLILHSELPHVLTVCYKLWRFALCDKSFPVFFFQVFELLEGVLLFSQTHHKSIFVAPPRMRDALHSCPLPLLFHLFWIYNVSLNRVHESSFFSSSVRSSNFSRVSGTLCRTARPQTLLNLISVHWSKGCLSSLTSSAFITSIGHVVYDLAFHFLEVVEVSGTDHPVAPESTGASSSCCS